MDTQVTLSDGRDVELSELSADELLQLHWDEERTFARKIMQGAPGSSERKAAIRDGYNLVSKILYRLKLLEERDDVAFGYSARNEDLIREVLARMVKQGVERCQFFEVGFGLGTALALVAESGHDIAGLEVAPSLVESARAKVPAPCRERLLQGDFATVDLAAFDGVVDVVYWNDVFEHVPPDEMPHYLARIASMLRPGGVLVTVTPNWHVRPSDVTRRFRPPRSDPEGFHLKEYTVREITALLGEAGFQRVQMPLVVTRQRTFLLGSGAADLKRLLEPMLEYVPHRLCRILAGALGYNCTIAVR